MIDEKRQRWYGIASGLILVAVACHRDYEHVRAENGDPKRREAHSMVAMVPKPISQERARFNGEFELCPSDQRENALEKVDEFILRHYGPKSSKARDRARKRLGKYINSPYLPDRFELVVDSGENIIMNVERSAWTVTAPSNGGWRRHPDWENGTMLISFGIYADERGIPKMVQQFRTRNGTRLNVSHIDAQGNLQLTVILESKLLPEPLIYEVTYCRKPRSARGHALAD